ncbi:DUF4401 domain-containing protein [Flagellimonas olearia]|uniref:DUF4401 domain-containing protein n=1 Tax=Flagellimonas olearia TaxID=552546 RepID=A0A6I1E4W4_9FLAO|nr:DUF4401 domain-containing protein [Allomuricauda olearia]KAB7528626.1 DUF4401 domain-containing protein [Allomuricauda olearia]
MDKVKEIKTLLDTIGADEGPSFSYDENAIKTEYAKQHRRRSNLVIKVLSVFGILFATIAFFGFLALLGIYDSELGMLLLGSILITLSLLLNVKFDTLIIDTFGASIYVLGIVLIVFGLASFDLHEDLITLLVISIALCSLFIVQNYIVSFISVLVIASCFLVLIFSNDLFELLHFYLAFYALALAYCSFNESLFLTSGIKMSKVYGPLRVGLIFSLLFGLVAVGINQLAPLSQNLNWTSSLVHILIILYLVGPITKTLGVDSKTTKIWIYALAGLTLLPTLFAPSISGALLIVLLSFRVHHKTGLGIGVVALIYFIIQYYYDLNLTLLVKSMLLFSSGVVFLLFYIFLTKKSRGNEKV